MRLAPEFLFWSKRSQPSGCLVDYFITEISNTAAIAGVSLLAIAQCQSTAMSMTHRHREQARSHSVSVPAK
jgi:hypothetical protein